MSLSTTALRLSTLTGASLLIAIWHLRYIWFGWLEFETENQARIQAVRISSAPLEHRPAEPRHALRVFTERQSDVERRPLVVPICDTHRARGIVAVIGHIRFATDDQRIVTRDAVRKCGGHAVVRGGGAVQHLIAQERPPPVSPSSAAFKLPALMGWLDVIAIINAPLRCSLPDVHG